ncbi:MAG: hypothetical protein NZ581_04310 [Candidatus Caldarchaeum sp.]|nr:hypothetical protein [Candidatus Caldarchaeum sp.]MDW8435403.1 DUF411 domain-containing protein [Candidatus Caldarchaeum sp.]
MRRCVLMRERPLKIYRDENRPCCRDYERYLRSKGIAFQTVVVKAAELEKVRTRLGVPEQLHSCHSAEMGPYFVEGHVPVEAIAKLLSEKPAVDGIAVPGMPAGSPGMGGVKNGPIPIYAKAGDEIFVWMLW